MKHLWPILLLLVSCAATDEHKPKYSITFHAIASEMDPPKTMFPLDLNGRRMLFKVVPEFSQQNVIAFHPFPSEGGKDNGVVLQLDFRGKAELEIISRTRKDEYLLAMVNAKPVDVVVLDQPVLDGVVTIWQGVPDAVIHEMDKKVQRIRKGGQAPSMSENMEMRPTTKGEKLRALKAARAEERAERAGVTKKAVPALNLPGAPVSPKLPVEGAAPAPVPVPVPDAPLPKP